jgi:hypothetical protein
LFVTGCRANAFITKAMQGALRANVSNSETCRHPVVAAVIVESSFLNLQKKGILYLAYDVLAPQDL